MKIYTRTGDKGQTSLFGGERVSKSHARVSAYGTLDELNSFIGFTVSMAVQEKNHGALGPWLEEVQKDLFALGSWLASPEACERLARGEAPFPGAREQRTTLNAERIQRLENQIDEWETKLSPMKSFILPGGGSVGAALHYSRTLCRRAERETVALREMGEIVPEIAIQYLNRLADALFVAARFANHLEKKVESPWA